MENHGGTLDAHLHFILYKDKGELKYNVEDFGPDDQDC